LHDPVVNGGFRGKPNQAAGKAASFVLEVLAVGLALVTGWLGGELVERLGVGVDDGAHLDAPSSLEVSHSPAGVRSPARLGT
jgi:hypothetical protein